jgi:hypothetical protein
MQQKNVTTIRRGDFAGGSDSPPYGEAVFIATQQRRLFGPCRVFGQRNVVAWPSLGDAEGN